MLTGDSLETTGDSLETQTPCSEQKIAQFRTHDLTKILSYVSTPGQFDTFLLNHFSVHWNLA